LRQRQGAAPVGHCWRAVLPGRWQPQVGTALRGTASGARW